MATLQDIKSADWQLSIKEGQIVQGLQDIWQCIFVILTTQKGTDPTRPNFGCGVYEYVDKPINVALPNMKREIIEAISLYEPRVKIIRILHTIGDAQITFKVEWGFGSEINSTIFSTSSAA